MMMVSDEEKRWIVVGIAMNKVAAPVLRDVVKKGMDTNYANLDRHCQLLHPPCNLKTLTHGVVRADPILKNLKFQNINNNHLVHDVRNYNFKINSSVDLAKLYLPDYLTQFSAFDESLDMTAILLLLGCKNYMPATVFSPHIQASADDVRENVRNKWGHVDVTEWTHALFNDCFDKLKTLVRSLGLTAGVEKNTMDQLDDWQSKGCRLIMGHAVDRDLLCLVQDEVKDLIKDYNTIHSQLNLQNKQIAQLQGNVATLIALYERKETRLVEHHKRLETQLEEKLQEESENRSEEITKILERLVSLEAQLSIRLQVVEGKVEQLEQTQTKTDDRVEQLEQSQTNTVCQVELLKHSHTKTADEVELLKHSHTKTADEVELLKHSHTKTTDKVELLKHSHTKTADEVELLKHSHTKTADKVELLKHSHTKTTDKVELLKHSHTKTADEVELLKHSHTKTADEVELLKHSHTKTADEVELLKHSHTKTTDKVELLKHSHTKTADEVELLKHSHTKTTDKVELLKHSHTKTADKVELLKHSHTKTADEVELLKDSHTKTTDEVELLKHSHTKTADEVELLKHSHTKTADEVELLKHSHTKTADEVELLKHSHTKTADKVELLKHSHTKTADKVELLKHSHTKTTDEVELLKHSHTKTTDEVELLKHSHTKTADEVELLKYRQTETAAKADQFNQRCAEVERIGLQLKTQKDNPQASSMKPFDFKSCRSKLEDHYQKTASVPTSVWSKKAVVDIHQIYTRLSWVKEEQTPAGTTHSELKHYTELFTANKNGVIPKRILVQGQTGIGKSTFVKKLLVDWVEVNKGTGDEQAAVLKNFELVVAVNLKEVSKCQSLEDVITLSNVFAKEDKYMTGGLMNYITNNQEKVLLIFDGYDEYRSGCDSEIYGIFRGNSLRSCCVLITSRISKADELRGGEDLHAEITGFSKVDGQKFMRRFLTHDEVFLLEREIYKRKLNKLAEVPLLLLFFCLLWRKGQFKHFPETKAKLYIDIIQFILNHSYSKQSPPQYVEVTSFKEILSEIGRVALQALLKDDHLFEYGQLSDSVRCDKGILIGLLQITEYSDTLRPVEMVSFIHKSIQEFLAAWYVTYKFIPEGGNLGEISPKLEECLALENVFQFICGLSEDGGLTALRHFKSVRILDPSLDLSKAVPDLENETGRPLSDVTERQWKFSCLVFDSFEQIESKAGLSRACFDCLGEILLYSPIRSLQEHVFLKAKETNSWSLVFDNKFCLNSFPAAVSTLNTMVKTLSARSSKVLKVAEFLEKFRNCSCNVPCTFSSVICFHNGQVYFNITHLRLLCEDHFRVFTEFVASPNSVHSTSGPLCLKFLKTLECSPYGTSSMEPLGAAIKDCNHLELIQVCFSNDSLCHFLEQVPNPSSSSLSIGLCTLTSPGAAKFAYLLPRFENVTRLVLRLGECSDEAVTSLAAAIKHKTLGELNLHKFNLSSAAAVALVQSLHASQALQKLNIGGFAECSDEAVTSLVAAIKHKTLTELSLAEINLTSAIGEALGQSLRNLSALQTLNVSVLGGCSLGLTFPHSSLKLPMLTISGLAECSAETVSRLVSLIKLQTLTKLTLSKFNLTSPAAEALGQLLPELSAVKALNLIEFNESSAEAVTSLISAIKHKTIKKLELLGVNLTSAAAEALSHSLPKFSNLQTLRISNSNQCFDEAFAKVVSTIKHKTLKELTLIALHLTSAAAAGLGQTLPELSALERLECSGLTLCSPEAVTSFVAAIKQKTLKELILSKINLTSAVAEALGQSLPELLALQTLVISGSYGYSLQHTEMKAMFGTFNKPSLLKILNIRRFSARGSLTALTENFCFFPRLKLLHLEDLDLDEADFIGLLENLKFIPDLCIVTLNGNPLGHAVRLMVPYSPKMEKLEYFGLRRGDCSDEDLNYVREAVKGKLPQLRIVALS